MYIIQVNTVCKYYNCANMCQNDILCLIDLNSESWNYLDDKFISDFLLYFWKLIQKCVHCCMQNKLQKLVIDYKNYKKNTTILFLLQEYEEQSINLTGHYNVTWKYKYNDWLRIVERHSGSQF